jgi:hypothetical protein
MRPESAPPDHQPGDVFKAPGHRVDAGLIQHHAVDETAAHIAGSGAFDVVRIGLQDGVGCASISAAMAFSAARFCSVLASPSFSDALRALRPMAAM